MKKKVTKAMAKKAVKAVKVAKEKSISKATLKSTKKNDRYRLEELAKYASSFVDIQLIVQPLFQPFTVTIDFSSQEMVDYMRDLKRDYRDDDDDFEDEEDTPGVIDAFFDYITDNATSKKPKKPPRKKSKRQKGFEQAHQQTKLSSIELLQKPTFIPFSVVIYFRNIGDFVETLEYFQRIAKHEVKCNEVVAPIEHSAYFQQIAAVFTLREEMIIKSHPDYKK